MGWSNGAVELADRSQLLAEEADRNLVGAMLVPFPGVSQQHKR